MPFAAGEKARVAEYQARTAVILQPTLRTTSALSAPPKLAIMATPTPAAAVPVSSAIRVGAALDRLLSA